MKHLKRALWALLLPLALSACSSVTPNTPLRTQSLILTVTKEDDSGPGTLRSAIAQAISGDRITFAENVKTIALSTQLLIDKNLTIMGPEGGSVTVSGGGATRVLIVSAVTVELRNLTISDGSAFTGGGIYNDFGTLTLTNSTVSGNSASYGGGIYNSYGDVTLTNSTAASNSASYGGGIYNNSFKLSLLTLTNSTVAGNSAALYGGGIFNSSGTLTLTNSIVALNNSGDIFGNISSSSNNIIGEDPGLDPAGLQDNGGPTQTIALMAGSPAINKAANCPTADQRGVSRPQGNGCDIGAFELEAVVTLSVDSSGGVNRKTGVATVSGSVSCSLPTSFTLDVTLSQAQTQRKTTTTVTGSERLNVSCSGTTPWTVTVSGSNGSFKSGSASVTATEVDSNPLNEVTQAVELSWVK